MWILPQHHTQIDRFYDIIDLIKTVKSKNLSSIKDAIIFKLSELGKYKWRQTKDTESAANHNIDEPFFYGFVYKLGKELFVSGYWELIYKVWDDSKKRAIVFLFSLFNIQYFNPAKKSCKANIFPFRLFFKCLRDYRLGNKICIPEMFFLYELDSINQEFEYDQLVCAILNFRKYGSNIGSFFKDRERDFVKSIVSASYFFSILQKFGILQIFSDLENQTILFPDRRDVTSVNVNQYQLSETFFSCIDFLLSKYSIFEIPRKNSLPSELITEIYNFVDLDVYWLIGETYQKNYSLADDIYNYSIDPTKCYDFEEKVSNAFNMFFNVTSEPVWWSGEPDFVARFKLNFPDIFWSIIFTGEAKSTKNTLNLINPGRLKQHMNKYCADYSILITPRYSPAAQRDIDWERIVILSSFVLSEMVRNFIKYWWKPDFFKFNELIQNNLWTDVSPLFYDLISQLYGVKTV